MGIDFFAQKSIFVLVVKIACGIILEEGTYRKVILMQMSFFSLDNSKQKKIHVNKFHHFVNMREV